jgi:excisionase family DNA binding protein
VHRDVPRRLLYPPAEVAELLGLGRTKVFELLASGQLRSVTVDSKRLVPAAALDELVAQLERKATAS